MRLTSVAAGASCAAAWVSVVALAIGRLGGRCDACDLANIGRPYWLALGIAGIAVMIASHRAARRSWWVIALTIMSLSAAGSDTRVADARNCAPAPARPALRVIALNAWQENAQPWATAQWLRRQRPDVIVLVEAKGSAAAIGAYLAHDYPYRVACNARMRCSTQIFSRVRPLSAQSWGRGDAENRKVLSATAIVLPISATDRVTVVGVHLSRPLPLGRQRSELATLSRKIASAGSGALIVAGDFNATADNTAFREFAALHRLGRVPTRPTWPTTAAAPGMPSVVAIDHILISADLGVTNSAAGPVIGSDHRPVVASLCVKPKEADVH